MIEQALDAVLRAAVEEFHLPYRVLSSACIVIDGFRYEWPMAVNGTGSETTKRSD